MAASLTLAQGIDSFEGGQPRWALVESDCGAQMFDQQISMLMPHGGRTCELFELGCGQGTFAWLAYPVEPSVIISEFRPSLWTRCSSSQIRLGVRVVFPFAAHPVTGTRLTTILWGESYQNTGQWQQLTVDELENRLRNESVSLRQRFGSDIRLDGAYIDSLVLNAYTGPGRFRVQVDDLDLRGLVSMAAIGNPPPPDWRARWRWRYAAPSREAQYWSSPNRPATWLQYRGEQLGWLQSLGLSGVVTSQIPSEQKLVEAKEAGLWVISPPPDNPIQYDAEAAEYLKAWMIGGALDNRQSQYVQHQAARVAALPENLRRPLVAEALEDYFQFSRMADQVIVPFPVAASAGSSADKMEWLSEQLAITQQRNAGWVTVNLGIPPSLSDQVETAAKALDPDASTAFARVDPTGFRHQATSAILAGAKGLYIRTFQPLSMQDPAESAQVAALRWLESDLRLWGPWIASGTTVPAPTVNAPTWVSRGWTVSDSQLFLVQKSTAESQFCMPPTKAAPLMVSLASMKPGQMLFRLTDSRLERVELSPSAGGLEWSVDEPRPLETFLVTSNAQVLNFVRGHLESTSANIAADKLELASHNMGVAARVVQARFGRGQMQNGTSEMHQRMLMRAQREIDACTQALRGQQHVAASGLAADAQDTLQSILFDAYLDARAGLASAQSSPLISYPAALHLHWQIADSCQRSQWSNRSLPGSGFNSLSEMLDTGWSQQRRNASAAELRVELVPSDTSSPAGLRMAAYAKDSASGLPGGFQGASLRVRSASTQVQAGELLRVSATARVLQSRPGADVGLLVYDNQAGPSLGQLVQGETGALVPIELYRFAVTTGEFRVLAECRGECDIVLESLDIDAVRPATNQLRFDTRSFDPRLFDDSQLEGSLLQGMGISQPGQ